MGADDAVMPDETVPLISVPNVSEGRDELVLSRLQAAIEREGCRVLDVHCDAVHNRSVFTISGSFEDLPRAAASLAAACKSIDLTKHSGVHPRLGVLDVCPFVSHGRDMQDAVRVARKAARLIASHAGLPVFIYGTDPRGEGTRSLPELRRGGLEGLRRRMAEEGRLPDEGPTEIDPAHGVVCVGARGPLIAFNVWLRSDAVTAQRIAAQVRTTGGGPPGVRALGWAMGDGTAQVSMNLIAPDQTGVDDAFEEVAVRARRENAAVTGCEIVGLPLERYLPQREAARLLIKSGRSLESVLRGAD